MMPSPHYSDPDGGDIDLDAPCSMGPCGAVAPLFLWDDVGTCRQPSLDHILSCMTMSILIFPKHHY